MREAERKHQRDRRKGDKAVAGSNSTNSLQVSGISDPESCHASWSGLTAITAGSHMQKIVSA